MQKTAIVILAAGYGKRMQSDKPKVLSLLSGKPLISHLLEHIHESGVCDMPVIVVGYKREDVMSVLGSQYRYAVQEEQLGTGHAVSCAREALEGFSGNVMVLYGDMPYVSADTIRAIAQTQNEGSTALTMATVTVPDFNEWRAGFYDFSRVIRDEEGNIIRTVEKKDATPEELLITEVNPCYLCIRHDWLWSHLVQLKNANVQKEYYLTDLIAMAVAEKAGIASVSIEPHEALGVNTKENLEILENLKNKTA